MKKLLSLVPHGRRGLLAQPHGRAQLLLPAVTDAAGKQTFLTTICSTRICSAPRLFSSGLAEEASNSDHTDQGFNSTAGVPRNLEATSELGGSCDTRPDAHVERSGPLHWRPANRPKAQIRIVTRESADRARTRRQQPDSIQQVSQQEREHDSSLLKAATTAAPASMQHAVEHGGNLPTQDLQRLAELQLGLQHRYSALYENNPGYMLQLFDRHLKLAIALAVALKAPPGSPSLSAMRPTRTSFKHYLCAMRTTSPPRRRRMSEVQATLESLTSFGHPMDPLVLELALAVPKQRDLSVPSSGPDALISGKIMSSAIAVGVRPTGQCFYLLITTACSGKELSTCAWAVQQLANPVVANIHPMQRGGIRSCLTEALLAMVRTDRVDDAGTVLATAEKLNIRIHAGAVQAAIPNLCERLRPDLLVYALGAICNQTNRTGGQGVAIKMDEGTMVAILNAAATSAHAPLARLAWSVLVRSLAQPATTQQAPATSVPTSKQIGTDGTKGVRLEPSSGGTKSAPEADGAASPSEADGVASGVASGVSALPDFAATSLQQPNKYMLTERTDQASRVYIGPMNVPCISAFHAVIHALGAAGELREAMVLVGQLCDAHPEAPDAASWLSLRSLVTVISPSVVSVDAAEDALRSLHADGRPVHIAMLNIVIAACAQVGDLARAFDTFEATEGLGLVPDVATYNALIWGCTRHGQNDSVPKLISEMEAAGIASNHRTRELEVESAIVARDIPRMLDGLQEVENKGLAPSVALLTKCVDRAERSADENALRILMARLDMQNYKIVGVAAKVRRWAEEGGMSLLVGGDSFKSRPMSGGYKHPDTVPTLRDARRQDL